MFQSRLHEANEISRNIGERIDEYWDKGKDRNYYELIKYQHVIIEYATLLVHLQELYKTEEGKKCLKELLYRRLMRQQWTF